MGNNGFLNLGEGLHLLFHDSSIKKWDVLDELFISNKGRLNRKSYIYRCFFLSFVAVVVNTILELLSIGPLFMPFQILEYAVGGVNTACTIFLSMRRFHDLGRSGLWLLLLCIPLFNILAFLYLIFKPGDIGPNDYGSDPLQ